MSISNQPSITEASILESYLLTPSPLPTALPYTTFLSTCVPAAHRSHPHVKRLYRDLQFQRNIDVDAVRENIDRECGKSGILKGRLARQLQRENDQMGIRRKRKRVDDESDGAAGKNEHEDENIKLEEESDFGDSRDQMVDNVLADASAHPASKDPPGIRTQSSGNTYTRASLLDSMEAAITSLEQEVGEVSSQNSILFTEMTETIGQLSDLRYGRFARPSGAIDEETMEDGIVEALQELTAALKKVDND